MIVSTHIAEALLRQFLARSKLLAPLGNIAETCWVIMLHIYASKSGPAMTLGSIADQMKMPNERVSRYVDVLADAGFIEFEGETSTCRLSGTTHQAVDDILQLMIQDLLSSLGK